MLRASGLSGQWTQRGGVDAGHALPGGLDRSHGEQQAQRRGLFHQVAEAGHVCFLHAYVLQLLRYAHGREPGFHGTGGFVGLCGHALEVGGQGLQDMGQQAGRAG